MKSADGLLIAVSPSKSIIPTSGTRVTISPKPSVNYAARVLSIHTACIRRVQVCSLSALSLVSFLAGYHTKRVTDQYACIEDMQFAMARRQAFQQLSK